MTRVSPLDCNASDNLILPVPIRPGDTRLPLRLSLAVCYLCSERGSVLRIRYINIPLALPARRWQAEKCWLLAFDSVAIAAGHYLPVGALRLVNGW